MVYFRMQEVLGFAEMSEKYEFYLPFCWICFEDGSQFILTEYFCLCFKNIFILIFKRMEDRIEYLGFLIIKYFSSKKSSGFFVFLLIQSGFKLCKISMLCKFQFNVQIYVSELEFLIFMIINHIMSTSSIEGQLRYQKKTSS